MTSVGKLWISSFLGGVWNRVNGVGVKGGFVLHLYFSDRQTRRDWLSLWCKLESPQGCSNIYLTKSQLKTSYRWSRGLLEHDVLLLVLFVLWPHPLMEGRFMQFLAVWGFPYNRELKPAMCSDVSRGQDLLLTLWSQAAIQLTEKAWCFLFWKKKVIGSRLDLASFGPWVGVVLEGPDHKSHSVCLN